MQEFHKTNTWHQENKEKFEDNGNHNTSHSNKSLENLMEDYFSHFIQLPDTYLKNMESMEKSTQTFSVLDPEILNKVILDAFDGIKEIFLEEPETWENLQKKYLDDLDNLFQIILDQCTGEMSEPIISPEKNDRRFKDEDWEKNPIFNYIKQAYLLHSKYLQNIIADSKVNEASKRKLMFYLKGVLDALSPTNFALTNPAVIRESLKRKGDNLIEGYQKFIKDQTENGGAFRLPSLDKLNAFKVGKNLATTPGEVVFENEIFQLIHFHPQTATQWQKPLLIVPPWINKYYIFDLREQNSFIRWNLQNGRSVFAISWVNPDPSYAELSLSDYILRGIDKAIDTVRATTNNEKINVLGFCVGGVALISLLAHHSHLEIEKVNCSTFLATPIDFNQLNELSIFVCEDQVRILDKHLQTYGVLAGDSMVKMFSSMRANDLIWSNYINHYLLAKETDPLDFLYWNSDTTHLPAKMHLEYLKNFFLGNAFIEKKGFQLNKVNVDIAKISIPTFVMAAKNDHIVPWQAAFAAIRQLKNAQFVLSASGHVAGVINHPAQNKYCYWTNPEFKSQEPTDWLKGAIETQGSWWIEWEKWMNQYQGSKVESYKVSSDQIIEPAPGRYALQIAPKL
ncbi:MAG: alpha/beta fold hydrolase [Alphaproteobacteria bacterium]|nr:alpha/beta fold hydrolase [Alphaproteobacteria bacterium]